MHFSKSRPRRATNRLSLERLESRRLLAFDPSGIEQAFLENINRMRLDPQGELDVIFSSTSPDLVAFDPNIQAAIDFFAVDSATLLAQWSTLEAAAPLVWNENLTAAAEKHSNLMLEQDRQAHTLAGEPSLGERVLAEGYDYLKVTENVYAFAESHLHGHAGFAVDWGAGPGGIQDPAGHRIAILDPEVIEIGISVVEDPSQLNFVGPLLVTQDFGVPREVGDGYLTGVVWHDLNGNQIYDPGEGLGGSTITAEGPNGTFTTTAWTAGGYQIQVPAGTYTLTASGGELDSTRILRNVQIGSQNLKVDFTPTTGLTPPGANDDLASTQENAFVPINVLTNDRYFDGRNVTGTVRITSQPSNGQIADILSNGQVNYQPNTGFLGADTFAYVVTDSLGLESNPATVTVNVTRANVRPTANPFQLQLAEDTELAFSLADHVNDSDGTIRWDLLEFQQPSSGTLSLDGTEGQLRYVPPAEYSGTTQFLYRVADDTGAFSEYAQGTIEVTTQNDPPQASADTFLVMAGETVLGVRDNDNDPDGLISETSIRVTTQANNGVATVNENGNLAFSIAAGFAGGESFEYVLVDAAGAESPPTQVSLVVTSRQSPWTNPINANDVDLDGVVAPIDALLIINQLGTTLTPPPTGVPFDGPLPDVNGDGQVAPFDALQVINSLIGGTSPSLVPPASEVVQRANDAAAPNWQSIALLPTAPLNLPESATPTGSEWSIRDIVFRDYADDEALNTKR